MCQRVNSLPNNKFLDCFKSKAFADDKIYVVKTLKFALGRVENNQHFVLFPKYFVPFQK